VGSGSSCPPRRAVLRALAERVLYPVPDEVRALFADEAPVGASVTRSMEASLWTNRLPTVRRLAEVRLDVDR
jgi:hypothetical protein